MSSSHSAHDPRSRGEASPADSRSGCCADEVTILDLAEAIQDVVGNHPGLDYKPLPNDDPTVRRPDTTKAEEIRCWKAQISLRQGLERTLPWFNEVLEF